MKPVPVQLETAERLALRRLASEHGLSLEQAASTALREWLIQNGYLELEHELDEESETVGSA
ncbi:hypothetical protein EET67_24770 [Pseudaminobacter arsenicus]|uniref:Ribbon-helix-helix protein, CopG family n=1 Tax=Borborobacter arsenicus TaxID=1851146 RepID=A0A432UZ08_9HYPH|nr:hypothetical protein [Pseudaminobacter arsenicus]RUM95166.1 hypothetical protein EET67_24770 [Pseudaminobacter arsenicus]